MSGHNKWSKIKHKKASTDAAKSKIFAKISKLITSESKKVMGNTSSPGLKSAIEKAKSVNMPNDNIERAVKKGLGNDAGTMESITYETYGPGGAAIVIETLTDNKNRTAGEIKHILSKNNLELASIGSALWAFEKDHSGALVAKNKIEIGDKEMEDLEILIEALEENDDVQNVYTNTD